MENAPAPVVRRHRLRTALVASAALIVLWGVAGALLLPGWLRGELQTLAAKNTNGLLRLGRIGANPYRLSFSLHDIVVLGAPGADSARRDTLLAARELTLGLSLASLPQRMLVLDRIALVGPDLRLTILPDSTLDWNHLWRGATAGDTAAAGPPPKLVVHEIAIVDGRLAFTDRSHATPFATALAPIRIHLTDVATLPDRRGGHTVTAAVAGGGTFRWAGTFALLPFAAQGRFDLEGLPAETVWRYVQDAVRFRLRGGHIDLGADYALGGAGDSARFELSRAALHVSQTTLLARHRDSVLAVLPDLRVLGARFDLARSRASVDSILARGGSFHATLGRDTVLDLANLFAPEGAPATAAAPGPVWTVRLGRVSLAGLAFGFVDSTHVPPARFDLDDIALDARELDSEHIDRGTLSAGARVEEVGHFTAEGHAGVSPAFADVRFHADGVPLRPFQAYVDSFIRLDIVRGRFGLDGGMTLREQPGGAFAIRLRGEAHCSELAATDSASGDDFLRADDVRLHGLDLDLLANRMTLGEVEVRRARATIALGTDQALNLFHIFPALVAPPVAGAPQAAFAIRRIRITDGRLRFVDRTATPPFQTTVASLACTIDGLASDTTAEARIEAAGKVDGVAPTTLHATMRPAARSPHATFQVSMDRFECTALSTYTGRFLGRKVGQGALELGLEYTIADMHIKGENKALLDRFHLGEKVESKDATHLPVNLALALMRDTHDRITLDIPVEGRLDDPKFGIGRVIVQVLINLVTRAALSPFKMLGGLLGHGGGGGDPGQVEFAAGSDSLDAAARENLAHVAQALADRGELRLEVTGVADSVADRAVLAAESFERSLRLERRSEYFGAQVPEPERAAQSPLAAAERGRLVAKLFAQAFPGDTLARSLPDPRRTDDALRRDARALLRGERPPDEERRPVPAAAPLAEAERRLLAHEAIDDGALLRLADARALRIKAMVADSLHLPLTRLFLRTAQVASGAHDGRVPCTLGMNAD